MKKILIVVAHPNIDQSVINKRWIEELKKYPERFTVHELYKVYTEGQIDVIKEQQLVENHDALVLQFPIYWFNCPPLLKSWLDEVFTYSWAYGSAGNQLKQRNVGLAVSTGITAKDYSKTGRYHYSLAEILRPFEVTLHYVKAAYQPLFAFYGAEKEPGIDYQSPQQQIEQSALDYVNHLSRFY